MSNRYERALDAIDDQRDGPQPEEIEGHNEAFERAGRLLEYVMEHKLDEEFTMAQLEEAMELGELGEVEGPDVLEGMVADLVAGGFVEHEGDHYRVRDGAMRRYNQQRSRAGILSEEVTEELDEAA